MIGRQLGKVEQDATDSDVIEVRRSDLRNLKKYLLGATPTFSGNTSWGEWAEVILERATQQPTQRAEGE